ncbi:hypothetical protein [Roseobacter sp. CCS2]|uniref:hypothetical protein n=1 Tax=Roseobacter sp. CCS2 TaxID=391593 RepID=UPI0000F3E2BA|nr:hypothetical protein [Roseobacter sp. CCS2]EBA12200.1 hypothetical protein RCCS2_12924 [Roseobacter sp. CCS2]
MRVFMAVCFSVLSHGAFAQDALFDLAGNWSGAGVFLDRNIEEDIRCRITVTSDDKTTDIIGVCASARRNENVDFSIIRNADGSLISRLGNENSGRRPVVLAGGLEEDGLQLSGQQGAEQTRITMQLTEPDTMEMTVIISTEARTQMTKLLFTKR